MNPTPLDRLCERYHIALEYRDIWGRQQLTSVETRQALLAAMDIPTESGAEMEQALVRAEAADWRRTLPPVRVAWEDEAPITIEIGIAAHRSRHRYHWTITAENGAQQGAEFRPADLELRGERVIDGQARQRRLLALPVTLDGGYHRLEVHGLGVANVPVATMSLIVAPRRCHRPPAMDGGARAWGPNLQLYAVRSTRNWGIGDFTDLKRVLEIAAEAGAGLVGLNPLHALFPDNPAHASPYGPSSRLFLNVLYLDVEAVPDFAGCEVAQHQVAEAGFQQALHTLRATDLVDYPGVARAKTEILDILYRHFRRHHLDVGSERAEAFRRFQREEGEALRRHALYEALQTWLHHQDPALWGWPVWPEPYRHPGSGVIAEFAAEHAERIEFFEYLQWQAREQLQAAARRASELGLMIGLYQDLAVSVDVGGAEAWGNQELYALGARIGSPPDDFNLKGQDWGLPPWCPERLHEQAYAPFIATLRENMRSAGMLRIDHVMSLMRLFWIPPGRPPTEGSYVSYPFRDMLGILALESRRNHCMVIGEDLGTVPDELRDTLQSIGVLLYRLLYFAKTDAGEFKAPQDFEPQALVAASTHDLPTLAGYWEGLDLELRDRLDLFPSPDLRERQVIGRAEDRARLLIGLEREGLLPPGSAMQAMAMPEMTPELITAIHRFLARTPAAVMVAQMEDILGQRDQVNLPGTTDQYPNWRRKLSLNLEDWHKDVRVKGLFDAVRNERGNGT